MAPRPATQAEARRLIEEDIEYYQQNPTEDVGEPFIRQMEVAEDPEEGMVLRPLGQGVILRTSPERDRAASASIWVNPYSQKIESMLLTQASDEGLVEHHLDTSDHEHGMVRALQAKFDREGGPIRAELDGWLARQRAHSGPGEYLVGDLYDLGERAGMDVEDLNLIISGDEPLPDHLGEQLVELGYTNLHGQTGPEVGTEPEAEPQRSARTQAVLNRLNANVADLEQDSGAELGA